MSKSNFINLLINIIIVCVAIAGTILVVGVFYPILMKVDSTPKSSIPKQSESHELLYARDKLLLESAKVLDEIDKRLERMEQDLREIREKLTE